MDERPFEAWNARIRRKGAEFDPEGVVLEELLWSQNRTNSSSSRVSAENKV